MKVRAGFNSQYARRKYDVEVDEGDLAAILIEAGLDSIGVLAKLTTADKHKFLQIEAELLALTGALATGVIDPQETEGAQGRVAVLQSWRAEGIGWLKTTYASVPVPG